MHAPPGMPHFYMHAPPVGGDGKFCYGEWRGKCSASFFFCVSLPCMTPPPGGGGVVSRRHLQWPLTSEALRAANAVCRQQSAVSSASFFVPAGPAGGGGGAICWLEPHHFDMTILAI